MGKWQFYGREHELEKLSAILCRGRWFFARVTGRRRIGKTSLIQQALESEKENRRRVLYMNKRPWGEFG